jgi:hypothetical protein
MTLTLLMARATGPGPVIFADPDGKSIEATLAAVIPGLDDVRRLIFPLPDETTRRVATPPTLMRSRHEALWHALSAAERSRVVLAAGETAAYLAPLQEGAITIAAIPDPAAARRDAWRAVLGPFPELDEVPDEPESTEERQRWSDLVGSATQSLELVRATDHAAVAGRVATALGLGGQRAARLARRASADIEAPGSKDKRGPVHWLNEQLYSLTAPGPDRPEPPL